MTRLVLANTLVSGIVTLQGIGYSFTASASGTATGSNVPVAREAAIIASNTAATLAARASIDKILLNNSSVLSDLEITSLISNNFTTTVRVFIPIALSKIATTTNGIDYFVDKETTIEADQWLMVPNGQTLSFNAPSKNYGIIQYGDIPQTTQPSSVSPILKTDAQNDYDYDFANHGIVTVGTGHITNINANATFTNYDYNGWGVTGASLQNYGTLNVKSGGNIVNSSTASYVKNYSGGTLNINDGGTIQVNGDSTKLTNNSDGTVNNNGSVTCGGGTGQSVTNYGTWNNNAACCHC
jgi:hypothetical protein